MAEISPGQGRKKTNRVKTEYSLPSTPGDDVMRRLDMELGRSGVQKIGRPKMTDRGGPKSLIR